MEEEAKREVFMEHLASAQPDLYAFAAALLPFHPAQIEDAVQEANLAMIRSRATYDASRPFLPWARGVAKKKILDFLREQSRGRVVFDSSLADILAEEIAEEEKREARGSLLTRLALCRERLSPEQKELLALCYERRLSPAEIAKKKRLPPQKVYDALSHVRKKLAECVKRSRCMTDEAIERACARRGLLPSDSLPELGETLADGKRLEILAGLSAEKDLRARFLDQMEMHGLLVFSRKRLQVPGKIHSRGKVAASLTFIGGLAAAAIIFSQNRTAQNGTTVFPEENAMTNAQKLATAAVAIVPLAATAENYAWMLNPANAKWDASSPNWNAGEIWKDGTVAGFGASSQKEIAVEGTVAPAGLEFSEDGYAISGGNMTLNGTLSVAAGATAEISTTVTQDNIALASRLAKTGAGTAVLSGENTYKRIGLSSGRLVLSGGRHVANSTGTTEKDAEASPFYTKGGEDSQVLEISGGAYFYATNSSKVAVHSRGTILVENGTLDTTGCAAFWNASYGGSEKTMVRVRNGGVFKPGKYLPAGINNTWTTNTLIETGGVFTPASFDGNVTRFPANIVFDGGTLRMPEIAIVNSGKLANMRIGHKGMIADVTTHGKALSGPFLGTIDGSMDGGLHVVGHSVVYASGANSFKGGVWLDSDTDTTFVLHANDGFFGAVPETPTNNIFFASKKAVYMLAEMNSSIVLHRNRGISIASNTVARISNNRANTDFVIQGKIDAPTNGVLYLAQKWPNGTVVLDPGEGNTNSIGQLGVYGPAVIASGVTLLTQERGSRAEVDGTTKEGGGTLLVQGGMLSLTGGVLRAENSSSFVTLNGSLAVTDGALADFSKQELLSQFRSAGTTTVSRAGTIICNTLRLTQNTGKPAENAVIRLETNGVIATKSIWADFKNPAQKARIDFDGGMLASINQGVNQNFIGDGSENYKTNIFLYVHEGGAIVSNDLQTFVKLPLRSATEQDGGFKKWGLGEFAFTLENECNGPIEIFQGGYVLGMQNNSLKQTATVNVHKGAWLNVNNKLQTVARIEGDGTIRGGNDFLSVTDAIAPGQGSETGTLVVQNRLRSIGDGCTLEIDVGETGADCLDYQGSDTLDLFKFVLKINDTSKLNHDAKYTIVKANSLAGTFRSTNLPERWKTKVDADSGTVVISFEKGTVVMLI